MSGVIYRRDATLIGVFVVLVLLLASCAPAAASTPTAKPAAPQAAPTATPTAQAVKETPKPAAPAPTPKPASEQPRSGGVLTLMSHSDPPNLDIHTNHTITLMAPIGAVYSGIVQYDQANNVVPDLAERWEVSPDGKTYTFFLRKGVKWHDGKPLTSADAKMSLERMAEYSGLQFITEMVSKVEAPDESTVRVILKQRQPAFLPLLGHGRALVGPKHVIDAKKDLKKDAVGTGPFKLKEYLSGTSFVMEKNKDYFVKDRPYLDGVIYYIIKDTATRFAAFRSGRVLIHGHPPVYTDLFTSQVNIIKKDMPQAVVRPYKAMSTYGLVPNWARKPWDDVRVRRAAFLAVDREQGMETVSEGVGTIGVSTFFGEWALPMEELKKMPGFRKPKDQDIAEAKRLLAEAGYPNGFRSTILTRAGEAMYEKGATFLADQLSKIGIELSLQVVEYAIYLDSRNRLNFDTMLGTSAATVLDPEAAGRTFSRKLGGQFSVADDDKLLELFYKQSATENKEERKKIVYEIQYRIAEVVPHLAIGSQDSFIAFAPQVRGYTADSCTMAHNKLDDIWLAK